MSKQPAAYLADIRQESVRIQAFIHMTAAAFAEDAKTQYAAFALQLLILAKQ